MKKLIIAILMISLIVLIASCERIQPGPKYVENVSYYETHLYTGESTNFAVTLIRGKREEIFIADGNAGALKDFATLKVTPLKVELFNKQYTYKVIGADGELEGDLSKDMFGVSFSTEIEGLENIGELSNIIIKSEEIEDNIEINNRLKDTLKWDEILEIAGEEFKDKIDEEIAADNFKREIHIKFINNRTDRNSPYYWYIAFINSTVNYWALLIDPETGDIISKKM